MTHTDMLGRETILAPRFDVGRMRADPVASRRRRFLSIAVLLSVAAHLAAALLVVYLPRFLPHDAPPQEQGAIELLMVEQKGAEPTPTGQPSDAKPSPAPPEKVATAAPEAPKAPSPPATVPPKGEAPPSESTAAPAPDIAEHGDEPVPTPSPTPPPVQAAPDPEPVPQAAPQEAKSAPVPPPNPPKAPVFDLEGTDSESNATVMGDHVLPAMPDDHFRNRPPIYPIEAQTLGQHGEVVIVIHVAANGLAAGADVMESSGFSVLDEAALNAVRKWHFHPAMKEGQAIPFDFPFRFIFEPY